MGRRGPLPMTPATLKLTGSYRRDRHANRRERAWPMGRPELPAWLEPEDRAEWERLVATLDAAGILSPLDGHALGRYVAMQGRFLACVKVLEEGGVVYEVNGVAVVRPEVRIMHKLAVLLLALEREFGMTPAARRRVRLPAAATDADHAADAKRQRFFEPTE